MENKEGKVKEAKEFLPKNIRKKAVYKLLKRVEDSINNPDTIKISKKLEKANILTAEDLKSRFTI